MTDAILRILAVLALIFGGFAFAAPATASLADPMAAMATPSAAGDDCCDNQSADMDACLAVCAAGCGLIVEVPAAAPAAGHTVWRRKDRLAAGIAPSPLPGPPRA